MSKRPIPDIELYECTRDELYNRIYVLREDKDALRAKLKEAKSALRYIKRQDVRKPKEHNIYVTLDYIDTEKYKALNRCKTKASKTLQKLEE